MTISQQPYSVEQLVEILRTVLIDAHAHLMTVRTPTQLHVRIEAALFAAGVPPSELVPKELVTIDMGCDRSRWHGSTCTRPAR